MDKDPKAKGFVFFLIGLFLGRYGIPIGWHVVYCAIIITLLSFVLKCHN